MSRDTAHLSAAEIARRCEDLGARVELSSNRYHVYPPDPSVRPVFMSLQLAHGSSTRNVIAELRRAGLDVTTIPEEKPTVAIAADAKGPLPTNGKITPKPGPSTGLARVEKQLADVLELIAETDAAHRKDIDELRARLDATPGAPPARDPNADLDEAILAVLASAPIKLSAAVVAANLDGHDADVVAARLGVLAEAGKVAADGQLYRLSAA